MRSLILLAIIILFPIFVNAQSTEALQTFEGAVAESRTGRHSAAVETFQRTLTVIEREAASSAFFAKVHFNLGVSLYHLHRLPEASVHLKRALGYARNNHAKAHYVLGITRYEMNDMDQAEESLKHAVALDNRNGDAWYDLGRVYLALNEAEKARRAFAKAVKNGADVRGADQDTARVQPLTAYE